MLVFVVYLSAVRISSTLSVPAKTNSNNVNHYDEKHADGECSNIPKFSFLLPVRRIRIGINFLNNDE